MLTILNIPKGVDYSDPHNVIRHTTYKNAIDDWQELDDKDYCKVQGGAPGITSCESRT